MIKVKSTYSKLDLRIFSDSENKAKGFNIEKISIILFEKILDQPDKKISVSSPALESNV